MDILQLEAWIYKKLSERRSLIILASSTILLYLAISLILALGNVAGSDIIAFQLAFSKKKVVDLINKWGPNGVKFVLYSMILDFLYPLSYSALISSVIANPLKTKNVSNGNIKSVFTPFIAALLDYVENIMEITIIKSPANVSELFVFAASTISVLKWALIGILVIYALYLMFR